LIFHEISCYNGVNAFKLEEIPMQPEKIKISTQATPENWEAIKHIADEEGKKTASVVDEAFELLIEKKRSSAMPRKHVMDAFTESTQKYDELYKLLAK